MHYYSFNISDFNNSTRHLTRLERSIYRDLIDMYYDTEQPIPSDIKLVSRKIIANLPEEIEVIQQILSEFFTSTDDGYTKKRIDKEIDIYHSKADTARANGKLGGRPKKSEDNPDKPSGLIIGTDDKPKANPEKSGSKANQELITNNHKLITKENRTKGFVQPLQADVHCYFLEKGLDTSESFIESEKFFNHYESNGWKVGKNKMKSWKASASGWLTRRNDYAKNRPNTTEQDSINWDDTSWADNLKV